VEREHNYPKKSLNCLYLNIYQIISYLIYRITQFYEKKFI
jgi:hypothetical protein